MNMKLVSILTYLSFCFLIVFVIAPRTVWVVVKYGTSSVQEFAILEQTIKDSDFVGQCVKDTTFSKEMLFDCLYIDSRTFNEEVSYCVFFKRDGLWVWDVYRHNSIVPKIKTLLEDELLRRSVHRIRDRLSQ
jgi:hypothetical protein